MNGHHEHWWRFFPHEKLMQIYISLALRSLAISLIGLFVPLYLHNELGYSLEQTLSFYIIFAVVLAIAAPVAAKLVSKYGARHVILFSLPLYIIFISLLFLLSQFNINLAFIAAIAGVSVAFYWMGMHLIFYHASHHRHRGEEVGKRDSVAIAATVIGPLIGGGIITYFGFWLVFLLATILLLASGVSLLLSTEHYVCYDFSLRELIDRKNWRRALFFVSRGAKVMGLDVIWPLFAFIVVGGYFSLGILGATLSAVTAILIWLMGKYSDHTSKRKIVRRVIFLEPLAWIFRALAETTGQVFGATAFGAVSYGLLESPLGAMEYDQAKEKAGSYFVNREVFICLGRVLVLAVVLITGSLVSGLYFNAFSSLAALLF